MFDLLVTDAAPERRYREMALLAMPGRTRCPSRRVRQGLGVAMASVTEIFLMADHAAASVPAGLRAVRQFSPDVVVVLGLLVLMTLDARILAVTHETLRGCKFRLDSMLNFPIGLVGRVNRARFHMARAAIL